MSTLAGWRTSLLDDIARRGSGHTPNQSHPEYWDGGIPWVSLADSSALDQGEIASATRTISKLGVAKSSAVVHPAGTVILSRDAGVGKSAILAQPMAVSQHFVSWDCHPQQVLDNWFLYYWLRFRHEFFERMAVGSTIKTIGLPLFKRLTITYPKIWEQRKIAEILRTWDDAIERLVAVRAAKARRHRSLAVTLTTRGHDTTAIPLARIVQPITEKNHVGEARVLTSSATHGLVDQRDYFNRIVASADLSGYYRLEQGDFAYNRSSSNGAPFGAIRRLTEYPSGAISTLYLCFRLNAPEVASAEFLDSLFKSGYLDRQLAIIAHEGARSHGLLNVSKTDFFELTVPIPPIGRQRRIAAALELPLPSFRCWTVRSNCSTHRSAA